MKQKMETLMQEENTDRAMPEQETIDVLLVDDKASFLELATRYLQKQNDNINIETCQNPEEVLEKIEEMDIDCIVSDYQMPSMDGIQLLKQIRQQRPDLPFLLITSKGSEEVASKAISAGITDYIQKSGGKDTFQLLENRIRNAVGKVHAEQENELREQKMREREEYITKLYQTMSSTELDFGEKLQQLSDLGCDFFDMELGAIAKVDPENDLFRIERISNEHEYFTPGKELLLSETYCTAAIEGEKAASVTNPAEEGYEDSAALREFGIQSYIGSYLELEDGTNRTFFFVASEPREEPFTEAERTFHHMMAEWVKQEFEYTKREERLKEFTSIVSHDLKNPLATAEGYIDLASETQDIDDIHKAGDSIQKARQILEEVESLPTTSGDLEKQSVSLENCFKKAYDEAEAEPEYTAEDKNLEACRLNLVKLFGKLIENSVQHNSPDVRVETGSMENGFYYEDNGKGIPEEERGTVLDRGYSSGNGQGLGLYIVERIVDTHGWKLNITESEDGGARFEFYLDD